VAVSFGLFVPPRILRLAEYGGINVHPSLLPDFRGPAPLHHVLLAGRKYTGITIQTLSEVGFDRGRILAQTPPPGLEIPNPDSCTYPELLEFIKPLAGDMLSKFVQNTYLGSHDQDAYRVPMDIGDVMHAPKITTDDRKVLWKSWSAQDMLRRDRVLGRLWTTIYDTDESAKQELKRVIFEDLELLPDVPSMPGDPREVLSNESGAYYRVRGIPRNIYRQGNSIIIETYPGCKYPSCKLHGCKSGPSCKFVRINSVTIEGRNKQDASALLSFGTKIEKQPFDYDAHLRRNDPLHE